MARNSVGRIRITAALGVAALVAVALGIWRVRSFDARDSATEPASALETPGKPPPGLRHDEASGTLAAGPRLARPATRAVRVRVVGADGPIEGARVTVYRQWADSTPWASISDAEGRVSAADLEPLADGARVEAAREGCFTAYARLDPETHAEVELRMFAAPSIAGRVVDAGSGEPIAGAAVTWGWADRFVISSTEAQPSTSTDDGGAFRLPWPEGQFELALKASAAGHVDAAVEVIGWNGRTEPATIRIRMRPLGVIRGTVRTAAGEPVPGASVRYAWVEASREFDDSAPVRSPWDGRPAPCGEGAAQANAVGEFELNSLACGASYRLWLSADGQPETALAHPVRIDDPGREAIVDARFGAPGSIRARFVGSDGRPISGTVRVGCRVAPVSDRAYVEVTGPDPELDARGECEFPSLGGGPHLVEFDDPRWVRERRIVDVRPGQTERLEFRADVGRTFRGRVVDVDGRPVPGSEVHFYFANWVDDGVRTRKPALCDVAGRFQVRGFSPGPLSAYASFSDGARLLSSDPQVLDDATDRTFVLRARPHVRMRLVREDGGPVGPPCVAYGDSWAGSISPDSDGVVYVDVPPGSRTFHVRVEGCATRAFTVDPPEGETLDLGDQRFSGGVEISGVVVGADGEPIDDVDVRAPATGERTSTGRSGRFLLRLQDDGEVRIEAARPSRVFRPVVIDTRRVRTCVLRASRGAMLRARVREPDGRAASSVLIDLRPGGASVGDERRIRRTTDASGRFTCLVGPGRWSAYLDRESSAFAAFEAEDGSTQEADWVRPAR